MATTVWKRWAAGLAIGIGCLCLAPQAMAEDDPPGRVARLSLPDASVQWAPAGSDEWQAAQANWPLTSGDRVRLPAGGRAEMHAGAIALRLQGPAQLEIGALDDANLRLTLAEGSLNLSVRELGAGERVEVGTANLAMVVDRPGEFRVDADAAGDTTGVGVRSGAVTVYGENGESSALAAPRQARYAGRSLLAVAVQGLGGRDALDQWAAERTQAEEQSVSARYVSRETIGYQELDAHGEWASDATYGTVWYPRVAVADWAPYRYGQWRWVHPWGWTWIDDARWGFAPFHYGRWVQNGPRWGWVPGPMTRRPAYAPALVGFAGTPGHRPPPGRAHAPGSDWFPLAPGEAWRPPFGASQRYLDRVNRGVPRTDPNQPPRYQFQRRPDAVSTSPLRDLRPDEPVRGTRRERSPAGGPGPQMGLPAQAPGFQQGRDDHDRREGRQRGQDQQQRQEQWQRQQQLQGQQNDAQQRQEQMRHEQQQRESSARQQQRLMQDQQAQQLHQQRQLQEQQQRQIQEPHRQQDRFMRQQQEAQQRQMQDLQQRQLQAQESQQRQMQEAQQRQMQARQQQESQQRQMQDRQQQAMRDQMDQQRRQQMAPPRTAIPERQNPGENRGRPEGRERRQDR